jgi:hypothetical protein
LAPNLFNPQIFDRATRLCLISPTIATSLPSIASLFSRIVNKSNNEIPTYGSEQASGFDIRANLYESIMYLSNIPSYNISKTKISMSNHNKNHVFMQVGNSADPSNNHIEILDKIKKDINKNEKIKIICPLSYGKKDHAKKVIQYGKKLFGKNFVPLKKFMDLKTYNKLQSNIDIAIFNHQRQQAMGNILTLLYLGKKVYIRDDIVTWDFMQKNDIKVFSFNNLKNNLLKKIDINVAKDNRKKINSRFNLETFIEEWENIFNS